MEGTRTMNDDLAIAMGERLERIAVALEQIVAFVKPSELAKFHQEVQERPVEARLPSGGPLGPEPPPPTQMLGISAPVPSQAFRESRDLPAEPFAPFPRWSCPVHHGSKVVPAGVSKKTGKPYQAFVACSEPGCNEKPPR